VYVLLCAVVENEGHFVERAFCSYVKVVEMNGHFVAQAIFGNSGA
jgi:hypothetical protein